MFFHCFSGGAHPGAVEGVQTEAVECAVILSDTVVVEGRPPCAADQERTPLENALRLWETRDSHLFIGKLETRN